MEVKLYYSEEEMIQILILNGYEIKEIVHKWSDEIHRGIWEDCKAKRFLVYKDGKQLAYHFYYDENHYEQVKSVFSELLKSKITNILNQK